MTKKIRLIEVVDAGEDPSTLDDELPHPIAEDEDKVQVQVQAEIKNYDWDAEIIKHGDDLERKVKKEEILDNKNNKMINNFNQSWELLKQCVDFLEEHEPSWKKRQEERRKERECKERVEKASNLSLASKKRHVQRKITEHMEKLPRKEREKIEMEEILEKRFELQRIKKELWKHRGNKKKTDNPITNKKGENSQLLEKLEKIMEAKEKIRKEDELEKIRRKKAEERIEEMRKKQKQETMRRLQEQESRRIKLELKKKKEERFAMSKWVHAYIEENSKAWEKEKMRRMEERTLKIKEWEKKSRMEKIKLLREKFQKRQEVKVAVEEGDDDEDLNLIASRAEQNWTEWRDNTEAEVEEDEKVTQEVYNEEDLEDEEDMDLVENILEYEDKEKREKRDEEVPDLEVLEVEDEAEDPGVPDLGLNEVRLCLSCVHIPCLCAYMKLELKLRLLKNEGRNLENGGGEGGVVISKITPIQDNNPLPQHPNPQEEHQAIHPTIHPHKEEVKCQATPLQNMPLVARIGDSGGPHRHMTHNPSVSLHNRAQLTTPATNLEVKDGHQCMMIDIVEDIITKCMKRSPDNPGTGVDLESGCSMIGGARPKIMPTQPGLRKYKGVENKANPITTISKNKNSVRNIIDFFKREESVPGQLPTHVGNNVNLAESRKPPILPTLVARIPDKKGRSLSSVKPQPKAKTYNHPLPPTQTPPPNLSQKNQPPPPPPPLIAPEETNLRSDHPPPPPPPQPKKQNLVNPGATLKRRVSSSILERFNLLVSHPPLPSPPSRTNQPTIHTPPPSRRNQPKPTTPHTPTKLKSIKKMKKLELEKEMKRKTVLELKLGKSLKTWLQRSQVRNDVAVADGMRAGEHLGAGDDREQADGDYHDGENNC